MDEFLRSPPDAHADAPEVLYLACLEEGEAQQMEGGIIYRRQVPPHTLHRLCLFLRHYDIGKNFITLLPSPITFFHCLYSSMTTCTSILHRVTHNLDAILCSAFLT